MVVMKNVVQEGLVAKKSATTATTTGIEEFLHCNKDRISCVNFYLILAT
jgi:hypothetical protein